MSLARGLMVAAALAVSAWFGVGIRQAKVTDRASSIINSAHSLSGPQPAQVKSLLDAASWLNPDRQVEVLRGEAALLENDPVDAERILRKVTRSEPMNIQAWVLLAQAAMNGDRAEFGLAIRTIGRLDPRVK